MRLKISIRSSGPPLAERWQHGTNLSKSLESKFNPLRDETVTVKPTILNTWTSIYAKDGMKGLYRGVTLRVGIWRAMYMVGFSDYVKGSVSFPL